MTDKTSNASHSTAHTPGPWSVGQTIDDYTGATIIGHDGKYVAQTITRDAVRVSRKEEANARLIAAAPELLIRLQILVDSMSVDENDYPDYALYHQVTRNVEYARAAIAKATGQD